MKKIDVILSPLLLSAYPPQEEKETLFVITDILRASSSIIAAFAAGAEKVYPIDSLSLAEEKAKEGALVGAERNAQKCDFAHFGNAPTEFKKAELRGKSIFFTTTNGTHTLIKCHELYPASHIVIGGFTNISAVSRFAQNKDVYVVAAGWRGQVSMEDSYFAALLAEKLAETHRPSSDAIRLVQHAYNKSRIEVLLRNCDHAKRLEKAGREEDILTCLTLDEHPSTLPILRLDNNNLQGYYLEAYTL